MTEITVPVGNALERRVFTPTDDSRIVVDQSGTRCIDIAVVKVHEGRGRKVFEKIPELSESIKAIGLISPICLDNDCGIIAGERRYRAFLITGQKYIPFIFQKEYDDLQKKEAELEENVRRHELAWAEQIELWRQIDEIKRKIHGSKPKGSDDSVQGWTDAKTAAVVGVDPSHVSKSIKLAKKLKARPDLAAKVMNLPMNVAIRKVAQLEQTEKLDAQHKAGTLEVRHDVQHLSCVDGMKRLPDNSIDCELTDPPFGNSNIKEETGVAKDNVSYTATLKPSDNMSPEAMMMLMVEAVPEMYRVLKPGGHLYMFFAFEHYNFLFQLMTSVGFVVQPTPIIWDKGKSSSPFTGSSYPIAYEPIFFAQKPPKEARKLLEVGTNVFKHQPIHATKKLHAFQKPTTLLAEFISRSTQKGDIILDPFAGSAATIRAARELHRSGLGFEVDEENWKSAQLNLSTEANATGIGPDAGLAALINLSKGGKK